MGTEKVDLRELLAEARAIHLAMKYGAMTYEQAKERTKPMLNIINTFNRKLAKQYKVSPRLIKFQDLGRGI